MAVLFAASSSAGKGSRLSRWAGYAALGLFAALMVMAVALAATAALMIGLVVGAAFLVLRLVLPRPKAASGATNAGVLEARRTPDGWVVEAAQPR